MRRIYLAAACAAIGWLAAAPSVWGAEKLPEAAQAKAQELVEAALKTELAGPSEERARLLGEALKIDPDFAPARWHSGFVRDGDEWLTIDQAVERARADERLAAYRQRRDAMVDTALEHREVALWCKRQKLADQERLHWVKVLEFEPTDAEAQRALGLELYEGRLLTRDQITAEKQRAGEQLKATRHWQPKIVKWRDAIARGTERQREAALEELSELDDPAAIPALEAVLAAEGETEGSITVNRALVETMGRLPYPAATEVLMRRAVLADAEEVRTLAAEQLAKRPLHAFVPQLIAAMPGDIQTRFQIMLLPNGGVVHEHNVLFEGPGVNVVRSMRSTFAPGNVQTAQEFSGRALQREIQALVSMEAAAASAKWHADLIRKHIEDVLAKATGFSNGGNLASLQQQYDEYCERETLPEFTKTYYESQTQATPYAARLYELRIAPPSCFHGSTHVMTACGSTRIDCIQIGDIVLTQDPRSGELSFRPVTATTVRPVAPLVDVGVGSETIRATRGHPFWVNGHGWKMAKHLKAGDILHTLSGAVVVDKVSEALSAEAYNLVVSDFATYFVGDQNLLVHDNVPLSETEYVVPGLAAQGN